MKTKKKERIRKLIWLWKSRTLLSIEMVVRNFSCFAIGREFPMIKPKNNAESAPFPFRFVATTYVRNSMARVSM